MRDNAIEVKQLGKLYHLGQSRPGQMLRDGLRSLAGGKAARNALTPAKPGDFWALRDVGFEVRRGEAMGVIGRNGAGKSTLLKILSRIVEPTEGRCEIHGRVGSLLEVGTGFHPELTGRENVFLNGAILGMKRAELRSKFDEIVAFAEISEFIDTPVKRYSSGMYTRLAFAVAAHLAPEVLIVDEVLAVGDASFQQKCLGKMQDVTKEGRTVLFVSHNIAAVQALCTSGLVLSNGSPIFFGPTSEAIDAFYSQGTTDQGAGCFERPGAALHRNPRILRAAVHGESGYRSIGYPVGDRLRFVVECGTDVSVEAVSLGIGIDTSSGVRVATLSSVFVENGRPDSLDAGRWTYECEAPELYLAPGTYHVKLSLDSSHGSDAIEGAMSFHILDGDFYGAGGKRGAGPILTPQRWRIQWRPQEKAS